MANISKLVSLWDGQGAWLTDPVAKGEHEYILDKWNKTMGGHLPAVFTPRELEILRYDAPWDGTTFCPEYDDNTGETDNGWLFVNGAKAYVTECISPERLPGNIQGFFAIGNTALPNRVIQLNDEELHKGDAVILKQTWFENCVILTE